MENRSEQRDKNFVFKFLDLVNEEISDPFSEKLKIFVKKVKTPPKKEKINFLNETLGVSAGKIKKFKLGLISMQEKKIKKELLKLQEIYHTFQPVFTENFSETEEFFEKKFKKCDSHKKVKYFFCDEHRETGLMCNDCCEDHVKQGQSKIKQADLDKHSFYYFPNYIITEIESQILDLHKANRFKDKVNAMCESIVNFKKFLDYNYYFLNKKVDEKFEELEEFLRKLKVEVKEKIKQNYKFTVNFFLIFERNEKNFNQDFWFEAKTNINDEFYNLYNTVINKLCNFNLEYEQIVKNSQEKVFREYPMEDLKKEEFNLKIFEENLKKMNEQVPKYNCLKLDFDKIKQNLKENINVYSEILMKNEIKALKENLTNDLKFLENQKKLNFILDNIYSFKLNDLKKGKTKKETNKIEIISKTNENLEEIDFSHILPINAAKLNMNQILNEDENKVFIIGGIYKGKGTKPIVPHYFSIFEPSSNTFHLNFYALNCFKDNKLTKYCRLGLKVLLVNKDEIKTKTSLVDYYNLLLFGGDNLDGLPTNEVFLMKGISHILSGKSVQDTKTDNLLEHLPGLQHDQGYAEVLKWNNFVYFFGGVDTVSGDIKDSIVVLNLLDFNFRREFKLPKRLFAFSLYMSPARGNYLLLGGLSMDGDCISGNQVIYELSVKDNCNLKINEGSIFFQEIGRLSKRRIRPQIICEKNSVFVIGGDSQSLIEVFDIIEGKVVREIFSKEFEFPSSFKNSQFFSFSTNSF